MFKNIVYKLTTKVLLILGFFSCKLSRIHRGKLGRLIGEFIYTAGYKRRKIALLNIKTAFPEKDEKWCKEQMKGSFYNLGITLTELLAFKSFSEKDFHDYIKYENIELLIETYKEGKGLILLSGHFGNWELIAYTGGLFTNMPVTVIVKPQRNKYADILLNSYRTMGGNKIVVMNKAARVILSALRSGEAIALLADQNAKKDKDVFVDYFGIPAATYESPAELSLKYKAPIIMGFAVRNPDFTYSVRLEKIKYDDLEFTRKGVLELTKRHVAALENAVRLRPDLWAWQHRRWKNSDKIDYKSL